MGLCQLKSSSRVSVHEPVCFGRSTAVVVPFLLRLARICGLGPVCKFGCKNLWDCAS